MLNEGTIKKILVLHFGQKKSKRMERLELDFWLGSLQKRCVLGGGGIGGRGCCSGNSFSKCLQLLILFLSWVDFVNKPKSIADLLF